MRGHEEFWGLQASDPRTMGGHRGLQQTMTSYGEPQEATMRKILEKRIFEIWFSPFSKK
jgi:hypothetical protein